MTKRDSEFSEELPTDCIQARRKISFHKYVKCLETISSTAAFVALSPTLKYYKIIEAVGNAYMKQRRNLFPAQLFIYMLIQQTKRAACNIKTIIVYFCKHNNR
jgi:hypothetical protein